MNQTVEDASSLALIQIPDGDAMSVFTGEYDVTIAPLLTTIERAVTAFKASKPDPTTEEGRKAVGSFDHKLARSKTFLDNAGKKVNATLKELPKKIDANRRKAWDTIEAWQSEVTAPVEAWKSSEKARIDALVAIIEEMTAMGSPVDANGLPKDAGELRLTIAELETWSLDTMQEFQDEAGRVRDMSLEKIREALAARERYEADQAELAALRAAQADRDAKDARERAERDAAEAARLAAENEVARQRDAAERAREKADADAREVVAKAEREALEVRLAAEEAERKRLEDEGRSRRLADEADARAKQQEADALARQKAADEARAADVEYRRKLNTEAMTALALLLPGGDAQGNVESARVVLTAIVKGQVPHVTMNY